MFLLNRFIMILCPGIFIDRMLQVNNLNTKLFSVILLEFLMQQRFTLALDIEFEENYVLILSKLAIFSPFL